MTQFDIIGALRTYITGLGHTFIWGLDEFNANIQASKEYGVNELIVIVDLKPTPIVNGSAVSEINYSGLFFVGKKRDTGDVMASLDETLLQKYDRRLLGLISSLMTFVTTFACDNELNLTVGQIDYLVNMYNSNIDGVATTNISFVQ